MTEEQKKQLIQKNLNNCLTKTEFSNLGEYKKGKVRDNYIQEDKVVMIATDRQSAFDRILASVPFKGQVLNETSLFWFNKTKDIIQNHVIESPDPNVTVAKKCKVLPVEMVVRGYITGVTGTAMWTAYEKGEREFCGNTLPEGLKKNQKLEKPIITPTTKADDHDEKISAEEIIKQGLVEKDLWDKTAKAALDLFQRGTEIAKEHGLILVDTKYEFGLDQNGELTLVDEIHTPDSSRYWIADTYEERFTKDEEPEYFDKEFLRLWFKKNCDPYNDPELPKAPDELIVELSHRYISIYEKITGKEFVFPEDGQSVAERIEGNLGKYK